MENENKDFLGNETENTLTPEEKVQADISEKIADAAQEIQEEIDAANAVEVVEDAADTIADEWEDVSEKDMIVEKPEPAEVTVKKSSFIISLIGSAIIGALILFICLQIPTWISNMPEGTKVASVNGEAITDLDVNYYLYAEAINYANQNYISEEELASYDWDQEVDGVKLSETLKKKALDNAIIEVLTIQKAAENGVVLDDMMKSQISAQVDGILGAYGEEGFALRARTMGIPSIKQYARMYEKAMAFQTAQEDVSANPDSYYPEDDSVLNDYLQPDKASVKHILIKKAEETEDGAAPEEDKLAVAQSVLDKAKSGDDFDTLVADFNEDPGATEEGYTFTKGEMVAEFETAAFALKIGEISDIVESTYGYHVIKRIPGIYDLQGYWQGTSDVKISKGKVNRLSIADILADVNAATEALEAESAAVPAE